MLNIVLNYIKAVNYTKSCTKKTIANVKGYFPGLIDEFLIKRIQKKLSLIAVLRNESEDEDVWLVNFNIDEYSIKYFRDLRGDLITISRDQKIRIEYVDQTHAYDGIIGFGVKDIVYYRSDVRKLFTLLKQYPVGNIDA